MPKNVETPEIEIPAAAAVETPAKKSRSFAAVVTGDYAEALEDHRWAERMTRPELVRAALDLYADTHGISRPVE